MLKLLCRAEPSMSKEQTFNFKKLVYDLVKLNPQADNGYSLLHFACSAELATDGNNARRDSPLLGVVKLLIEVDADMDCRDAAGNTPLHVAALARPCYGSTINTLLQADAHIDYTNHDDKSPHELVPPHTACHLRTPVKFQTLQCLAARAIRQHNLVYENVLCPEVAKFVKAH